MSFTQTSFNTILSLMGLDVQFINELMVKFGLDYSFFCNQDNLVQKANRVREISDEIQADYYNETCILTDVVRMFWDANNIRIGTLDAKESIERERTRKERYEADRQARAKAAEEAAARSKRQYNNSSQYQATKSSTDPYYILGLCKSATRAEIREAYRRLALQYHPDVFGDTGHEKMCSINNAYEYLKDVR